MTCNHCGAEAELVFKAAGVKDTLYCAKHLPAPYRGTPFVSHVEKPADPVEAPAEAPAEKKSAEGTASKRRRTASAE